MSKGENKTTDTTRAAKAIKNTKAHKVPKLNSKKPGLFRQSLKIYFSATWKYKVYMLTAFLSTPLVIFLRSTLTPLLLANIVAAVAENPSRDIIFSSLLPQGFILLGVRLVAIVIGEIRVYAHWKMEIYAMYDLANLAFDTISAQSMQFHSDRFSGSLVSQTNKFISAYERLFDNLIWSTIPLITLIVSSLVVLLIKSPLFALGLIILIIVFVIVAIISAQRLAPLNEAHAQAEVKQTGQLSDSISNISAVKSYAKEFHEHTRYEKFNKATSKAYLNLMRAHIGRNVAFDSVFFANNLIILVFLLFGQLWFNLSFATLYLMITYATNIIGELWDVNNILKDFNRIAADSRQMTEILGLEDDVVDAKNAKNLKITHGAVEFKNITFQHADSKEPIFKDFNLQIRPGERVGLVGISGSGKTTLTKLLLRFADVQAGEIQIDGQDIKTVTQKSLREAVAYVPQETALFHRTISENIAYAKPNSSQKEIARVAHLASVDDFVQNLPDGYETMVGERGIKLSGGQRQRIAIARAILKDAPILILDEATSALDSESEQKIQEALGELMRGRTALVVAHRLSTVASLDRIVVLKNGEIIEQGTHAELLRQNGAYQKLWSRQSGAFLD